MDDMLTSANNAILLTRQSVNTFSSSLGDLADSVGTGAFLVIVAGTFALSATLGNLGLTGMARVDEYIFQPLVQRVSQAASWTDLAQDLWQYFVPALDDRSIRTAATIIDSLAQARRKYEHSR